MNEIILNGKRAEVADDATVATLVAEYNHTGSVAVAVNGRVVRKPQWGETTLCDGDMVMIIQAAYGG